MTQLDPDPTLFGTGRIDPLEAPDGSTEYSRALLWITNRAQRFAFGARVRVALLGDPIAAQNLHAAYQPLLDWKNDMRQGEFYEDLDHNDPHTNWDPNP